jgi:hypothetical protein
VGFFQEKQIAAFVDDDEGAFHVLALCLGFGGGHHGLITSEMYVG